MLNVNLRVEGKIDGVYHQPRVESFEKLKKKVKLTTPAAAVVELW